MVEGVDAFEEGVVVGGHDEFDEEGWSGGCITVKDSGTSVGGGWFGVVDI